MVRVQKWAFFFGPKNPDFGPKIRFFVWDPVFCQRGVRNPRRWLRFGTNVSSLRLFVPELRPFSWGEPGRRSKKSSPTPLWGHRLPVTALALEARGLDKKGLTIYFNYIWVPSNGLCVFYLLGTLWSSQRFSWHISFWRRYLSKVDFQVMLYLYQTWYKQPF